jgi:hypothetical protein
VVIGDVEAFLAAMATLRERRIAALIGASGRLSLGPDARIGDAELWEFRARWPRLYAIIQRIARDPELSELLGAVSRGDNDVILH